MNRKITSITILLLFSLTAFPQSFEKNDVIPQPVGKIVNGIFKSVEWYDAPIWAAYLARNSVNPNNVGDIIKMGPSFIEQEFSNSFNFSGTSPGSMDKNTIPDAIFFSRIALNLSLDIFTDVNITTESYQKVFLFKKSLIYTYVLTEYVKNFIQRTRPDGSDNRSFFSGHTSTTFAAATFLYKELHDAYQNWDLLKNDPLLNAAFESITFSVLYGWAGYVGYSRIRDKKHYVSDVVVGALVGSAISHFLYEGYFSDDDCFLNNISLYSMGKNLAFGFRLQLN